MRRLGFSLVELLTCVGIVVVLGGILFPVFAAQKSKISNVPNLKKISAAAIAYGQDFDDHIPILMNGSMRDQVNIPDGQLTRYGHPRTDAWPLILLPYLKDRWLYQDPRRDDTLHLWSRAPHATSEPGYDPYGATYRNQNRFPCFGVNYIFLSPIKVNQENNPTLDTTAISKSFAQAKDPAHTIFYVVSMRGATPISAAHGPGVIDNVRGFFVVNAPGMFGLSSDKYDYNVFMTGADCSGDWCGNIDPKALGAPPSTNFAYMEHVLGGNNVSFLDGHVRFMKTPDFAAGTNFLEAVPHGDDMQAGAVITDKKKYLWDLDGDYYGLY